VSIIFKLLGVQRTDLISVLRPAVPCRHRFSSAKICSKEQNRNGKIAKTNTRIVRSEIAYPIPAVAIIIFTLQTKSKINYCRRLVTIFQLEQ
jgi:hypothetical protein